MRKICVQSSTEQLYAFVAQKWVALAQEAIADHGAFYVSLAGGSTPKKLYEMLIDAPYINAIDWSKVQVFFGDERCVAKDHKDSNFHMAYRAMLASVPLPEQNIHAVDVIEGDAAATARQYESKLQVIPKTDTGIPRFDLMLLGMGDDGHTASLFPGTPALQESDRWACEVFVEKLQSWRVSLTFPVINAAATVLFLVSGKSKAPVLARLFQPDSEATYPVQQVRSDGPNEVLWCLDQEAARLIPAALWDAP